MDLNNVTCYQIEELCNMSALIKNILDKVREEITLDEEHCFNIRLILSELIINGFRHGKAGIGQPVKVTMNIDKELRSIHFIVDDGGHGFTYRNPAADSNWTRAESGRGLALVRALSSECKLSNNTGWVSVRVAV